MLVIQVVLALVLVLIIVMVVMVVVVVVIRATAVELCVGFFISGITNGSSICSQSQNSRNTTDTSSTTCLILVMTRFAQSCPTSPYLLPLLS